jgi:hypothetical protein
VSWMIHGSSGSAAGETQLEVSDLRTPATPFTMDTPIIFKPDESCSIISSSSRRRTRAEDEVRELRFVNVVVHFTLELAGTEHVCPC